MITLVVDELYFTFFFTFFTVVVVELYITFITFAV